MLIILHCFFYFFEGYGDIVPRSVQGRCLTIAYAICFIPLATVNLVFIGRCIVEVIELIVLTVEEFILGRKRVVWFQRKVMTIQVLCCILMLVGHAYLYKVTMMKNQTLLDCLYFIFITMSTIGFGDFSFDVEYIQSLDTTLVTVLSLVDPVLFYSSFSLLSSVISSAVNLSTDNRDQASDSK